MLHRNSTHFTMNGISHQVIEEVKTTNTYDMQLYQFTKRLFLKRLEYAMVHDRDHGIHVPESVMQIVESN